MLKDLGFLLMATAIIYDAVTGRVSGRSGGFYTRNEHPILFWVMTPILILLAAILLYLAVYDIYHHRFV